MAAGVQQERLPFPSLGRPLHNVVLARAANWLASPEPSHTLLPFPIPGLHVSFPAKSSFNLVFFFSPA